VSWRSVLIVGVLLTIALGAVGVWIDNTPTLGFANVNRRPHPIEESAVIVRGTLITVEPGDAI
jgi:hypothetical protein